MPERTLVVVHGMGQPTKDSVRREVIDTFSKAFAFYPSLKGKTVEDQVAIAPVVYNDLFDTLREKLAGATNVADRLAAIDGPLSATVAQNINDAQTSLGS